MDLALLRTFVTVARAGSVTVAARDLHLSQASVSRHLQRLESDLGTPLFLRRDGRRLELTDAAQRILVPATGASPRPRTAGSGCAARRGTTRAHRGRRGADGDVDARDGRDAAALPRRAPGRRRASLRGGQPGGRGTCAARRRLLDLRSAGCDEDVTADLECREIAPLTMHAVLPDDDALAGRHRIGLADICRETFVFREGSDALRDFLAACADAWIDPHVAHLVEEPMAAIRLLTAGEAITVAWAPVGRAPGPLAHSFRMIPIETAAPRTTLTAYWLSERRPPRPALDLVEDARAQLRTWGEPPRPIPEMDDPGAHRDRREGPSPAQMTPCPQTTVMLRSGATPSSPSR